MSVNKNILMGYSGHAYVVAEAAAKAGIQIDYYADKSEASKNPFELEYIGHEADKNFEGWKQGYGFILGVGYNRVRKKIADLVVENKRKLITVIHPTTTISEYASIGYGSFVAAGAAVNALAEVGNYVILNTGSVVEHECKIEDGAHIAPGAVLAGNVTVGRRTFIGANSVVKEGITIGDDVVVGAGSTIIKDILDGKKVVGNPGREI